MLPAARYDEVHDRMKRVDLVKRTRSVNAMLLNVQKRYGKDSHISQRMRKTVEKVMGQGKTRFSTSKLNNASLREISNFDTALSFIENSAYSTKAGRQRMEEQARITFIENNPSLDVSGYDKMIAFKQEMDKYLRSVKASDEKRYNKLVATVAGNIYADSFNLIDELSDNEDIKPQELVQYSKEYIEYLNDNTIDNDSKIHFFEYIRDKIAESEESDNDTMENNKGFFGRN